MSETSAIPSSDPGLADRWRRLPLALRTFVLCFTVAGVAGIATVMLVAPRGDATSAELVSALSGVYVVFLAVAVIMGFVSARRGIRAWLAGYAATVLAGVPVIIVAEVVGQRYGLVDIAANLIAMVATAIIVFGSIAALPFLLVGGLTLGARWISRNA